MRPILISSTEHQPPRIIPSHLAGRMDWSKYPQKESMHTQASSERCLTVAHYWSCCSSRALTSGTRRVHARSKRGARSRCSVPFRRYSRLAACLKTALTALFRCYVRHRGTAKRQEPLRFSHPSHEQRRGIERSSRRSPTTMISRTSHSSCCLLVVLGANTIADSLLLLCLERSLSEAVAMVTRFTRTTHHPF